ncbi:MAG TPA: acylphosphatase [Nitriliruptorales bacterium]|nr:acylphosphatase [Nitriliruptorales bacterium]
MGEHTIAKRLTIHGRVQGVFFRASSRDRAREAGAAGWVRNRPDGTVEMWLEGPQDAVASVERWVRDGGPRAARVETVDVEEREPQGHDLFEVRR